MSPSPTTARLSDPLTLRRGPAWSHRITLAPLTNWQSHADGTLGDDEYRWLTMRAQGGFAMTMSCAAHVQAGGQGFPGQLGAWSDAHLPGLARLAQGLHAAGSVSSLQLQHSGRRADIKLTGQQPVAPWDDTETGARALSTAEVEQLVQAFIAAALRGERAGFQGVELHGAHGYLLAQFLDAEHNRRNDRYGGSFENRTRILFEIIDGIRARCSPALQLGLRLSPERFGITMPESLALAQAVLAGGPARLPGHVAVGLLQAPAGRGICQQALDPALCRAGPGRHAPGRGRQDHGRCHRPALPGRRCRFRADRPRRDVAP